MTPFQVGDIVQAMKIEPEASSHFHGIVIERDIGKGLQKRIQAAGGFSPNIEWLESQGFTITIIEEATA